MAINMAIHGHIIWPYIQARRAGSRRAPFLCSFLVHHTSVRQRRSQKMAKRDTKWNPKTQTASGAVLGCKKAPKREPKWPPRAHKGPQYGSKRCQDEAQGRPNLLHELFQSKTRIRDSSGTHFMAPKGSQKGPKMDPKWSPKPHTFPNLFVYQFGTPFGTRWGPKMDPIRDTTT